MTKEQYNKHIDEIREGLKCFTVKDDIHAIMQSVQDILDENEIEDEEIKDGFNQILADLESLSEEIDDEVEDKTIEEIIEDIRIILDEYTI